MNFSTRERRRGWLARLSISTAINQSAKAKFSKNINVSATLKDAWGKTVGEWGLRKGSTFGQSLVFAGETEVLRPLLWTAEKPNLYTLEVVLKDRKRVLQSHVQRVGIREVTWDNAVLKLNGKPVKLRGVNYHNLSPVNGRAVTESEFLKDLKLMGWVTLLQVGLYLFLFTILQLQDYALLAGSIGLFVILAIVMRASQQIKWYSEN